MTHLKLERPLAVLDIESTGINPRMDRIIDLAIIKLFPDGRREQHLFRVNPGIPIPAETTAIHHITNADVAHAPPFRQVAAAILEILADCDLGGFGVVRFDIPMLAEEFARAGFEFNPDNRRIVDAQRIYHKKEPRDLSAALAFYCGEMHLGAHGAEADALATVAVLEAQLQKYSDLPRSLDELDKYCNPPRNPAWADRTGKLKWQNGELLVNFGVQNIGRNLKDLVRDNPKFLKWILKSDFPADTKRIVADALEGRFLAPPAGTDDGRQTTDDRL
ncbi:MAG: 3'-5' exonuclease [Kiritimatiellota bacterium]|nr:3'-5' exonuclease [Kiritimatiellota bacterium]